MGVAGGIRVCEAERVRKQHSKQRGHWIEVWKDMMCLKSREKFKAGK